MVATSSPPEGWADNIRWQRESKRDQFKRSPRSPLPDDQRGTAFPGLAYYEPDPAYHFVLPLEKHDTKETVTVETTADGEQTYLRWGAFTFEPDGEMYSLQAYRLDWEAEPPLGAVPR